VTSIDRRLTRQEERYACLKMNVVLYSVQALVSKLILISRLGTKSALGLY